MQQRRLVSWTQWFRTVSLWPFDLALACSSARHLHGAGRIAVVVDRSPGRPPPTGRSRPGPPSASPGLSTWHARSTLSAYRPAWSSGRCLASAEFERQLGRLGAPDARSVGAQPERAAIEISSGSDPGAQQRETQALDLVEKIEHHGNALQVGLEVALRAADAAHARDLLAAEAPRRRTCAAGLRRRVRVRTPPRRRRRGRIPPARASPARRGRRRRGSLPPCSSCRLRFARGSNASSLAICA